MGGALPSYPAYAFMACVGITLHFTVIKYTFLEIVCVNFGESFTFLSELIVADP